MGRMTQAGHIRNLQNRADFLKKRIAASEVAPHYDRAELASILWAIRYIEDEQSNVHQYRAFRNGSLAVLKKFKRVLGQAVRSDNQNALQYLKDWTDEKLEELSH